MNALIATIVSLPMVFSAAHAQSPKAKGILFVTRASAGTTQPRDPAILIHPPPTGEDGPWTVSDSKGNPVVAVRSSDIEDLIYVSIPEVDGHPFVREAED